LLLLYMHKQQQVYGSPSNLSLTQRDSVSNRLLKQSRITSETDPDFS